jgi:UDP-N-acetylglucosamine--N-acetylmuramyl-(pentapeptide) pyrophosphoryl-undecaprenol N-acetylglucosamine transferase
MLPNDSLPSQSLRSAPRRIAIVGSGTAGHVTPALALASAYQQALNGVEVLFIGNAHGFETRILPALGHPLTVVRGAPLFGVGTGGKLRAAQCLVLGMLQARRVLKTHGAQLVIGLGGYTSAGVLLAAWSLGLRTVIHEANIVPGLTNRLLGRLVHRVHLGFAAAGWAFSPRQTRVTGNPVQPEIVQLNAENHDSPANARRPAHILITGGSQGSPFLNRQVPPLLRLIADQGVEVEAWHQAGDGELEPIRTAYEHNGMSARVTSYIPHMADAYRWADFAITCAGALTLSELAIVGLPALFVPLSVTAGDHQTKNALAMTAAGGGWWVSEKDWNEDELAHRIAALLSNVEAWTQAAEGMRQVATPNAARTVVADCEALLAS